MEADLFGGWTDEARAVITGAMRNARARASTCIGLRDVALATADADSVRTLHRMAGFQPNVVWEAAGTVRTHGADDAPVRDLTPEAREAIADAAATASAMSHAAVRPQHLWLSLLARAPVRAALASHQISADSLAAAVRSTLLES